MSQRLRLSRPRHATIVAYLALLVALGGTAYAANTVGSADVIDESLTGADIKGKHATSSTAGVNGALTGADISGQAAKPSVGQPFVDGSLTTVDIKDGTLGAPDLARGAVTNPTLANDAVTAGNVLDDTLTSADLGSGAVASDEVVDDSLTGDDIGPSAVGGGELVDGAVTPEKVGTVPAVRAQKTSNQSMSNYAYTELAFGTETFDTAALHDNATRNQRLTAPIGGIYQVSAGVLWDSNPTGKRMLLIDSNAASRVASTSTLAHGLTFQSATGLVKLDPGDYVVARVSQDSGASLDVISGSETFLAMTWVAPG